MTHVTAQAALQKRSVKTQEMKNPREQKLSKDAFRAILSGLHSYISKLELKGKTTVWGDYAGDNSYATQEAEAKRQFVCEMVEATQPKLLFDLGCNSGDYSQASLDAGAKSVVGFDFDFAALEHAYTNGSAQMMRRSFRFGSMPPTPAHRKVGRKASAKA